MSSCARSTRSKHTSRVTRASPTSRRTSGSINHTVPIAIYAWLRHADSFRDAVEATIALGGDSDTTGAIVGGLMGATLGASAIPPEWLAGLAEWPRSVHWMRSLAERLAT